MSAPPQLPDLAQSRRLAALAAVATLVVALALCVRDDAGIIVSLGDTDDAMRLVMMRSLLHGGGWYDQHIVRLQPPVGVWMHWSRLIDGGLVLTDKLFQLTGADQGRAELMTRTAWPLFWIFPAVLATLLTARELAGAAGRAAGLASMAVLAAAVALVLDLVLYMQFHPGRVDHHDVQIALALLALAGCAARGPSVRGAGMGAVAIGLGLAIGLEALLFEAAFAGAFALRFLFDRREARRTVVFGLTLAGTTLVVFAIQTPPERWGVVGCDALALNLLAGAVVGGLGLAAVAWATGGRPLLWRLGGLAAAGAVALAIYLALDPHCLKGPFADVDPSIRAFWLDHVNEVKPWPNLFKTSRADAVRSAVFAVMGVAAWIAVAALDRRRLRDPAWLFTGLALALGIVAGWAAVRMDSYVEWFTVPPVALLAAELGNRLPRYGWVSTALVGAVLSPVVAVGLILLIPGVLPAKTTAKGALANGASAIGAPAKGAPAPGRPAQGAPPTGKSPAPARPARPTEPDHCFDTAAYQRLLAQPSGLSASEIDLGPFVLANTHASTLTAPYHRMSWGIVRAHALLAAAADDPGPQGAQAAARALGVTYILECAVHWNHADRDDMNAASLQKRLDSDNPPAWLSLLSPPDAALRVYRVSSGSPPSPVPATPAKP